jgi:hypothetical protein
MRLPWKRITDAEDAVYNADNPVYAAPWYGQPSTQPPTIGPSGQHDGRAWTFTLTGVRWLAQRSSPPAPDCPELDATPLT